MIERTITVGLLVAGLASLASGFRSTGRTTFRAVWVWMFVALLTVAASETTVSLLPRPSAAAIQAIRFIVGVATLCPLIALLGAKRPQNRAWQFVVLSFWCVLALPALQNLALHPDAPWTVHPLWSWFLAALILVGLTNYLPTRFAVAALLAACGQWILLAPQLPGNWIAATQRTELMGFALLVAAVALAAWLRLRRESSAEPLDRLWLDFRNQFGVVWSLRIAERMNASAAMQQDGVRLTWYGFSLTQANSAPDPSSPAPRSLAPATRADLEQLFHSLLLRFVSSAWIERRLQNGAPS